MFRIPIRAAASGMELKINAATAAITHTNEFVAGLVMGPRYRSSILHSSLRGGLAPRLNRHHICLESQDKPYHKTVTLQPVHLAIVKHLLLLGLFVLPRQAVARLTAAPLITANQITVSQYHHAECVSRTWLTQALTPRPVFVNGPAPQLPPMSDQRRHL